MSKVWHFFPFWYSTLFTFFDHILHF
jgi:hypothetical protein